MVELIQIDADSSFESARRQIGQAHSEQVVLYLPHGWAELDNMARMRLLQREAQSRGINLGIITRHEATRKAAKQLRVPVFVRPQDAMKGRWRMKPSLPLINPDRPHERLPERPHWQSGQEVARRAAPTRYGPRQQQIQKETARRRPMPVWLRWIGYTLMAGLIALCLGLFGLYILPAATITLVPGQEPITVTVQLIANPNLDVPDLVANELPARLLETRVEETGSVATTGLEQKPSDKAVGAVTFSNLGNTSINIPSGTLVGTSTGTPITFRTTRNAQLEGRVGARVDVSIEAVSPGVSGNVRANTINTVNGAARFRTNVINSSGTYGGGSELVSIVKQADKDKLLAETKAKVEANAYQYLQDALAPDEWLPSESVQTFVIAQVFEQFNDDEADLLDLDLRVLVQGVAIDAGLTRDVALVALQEQIPDEGKLVVETLNFFQEPGAVVIGREVQFSMTVSANYIVPIDLPEAKALIAGRTLDEAVTALQETWLLERPPEIYRDPEWLPTLPALQNRIQIRVAYDEE